MPTYMNKSSHQIVAKSCVFAPGQIKSTNEYIEDENLVLLSMSPSRNIVRDFREIVISSSSTVVPVDNYADYIKIYKVSGSIEVWPTNFGGDGNELIKNNDLKLWNDVNNVPYEWDLVGTITSENYIRRFNPNQENRLEQVEIHSETAEIGISQDILSIGEQYYWSIYIPYIETLGNGLTLTFGTQTFVVDSLGVSSGVVVPDDVTFKISANLGPTSLRFSFPSVQKLDGSFIKLETGDEFKFETKSYVSNILISSASTAGFTVLQSQY